jgi:hypothetical protein
MYHRCFGCAHGEGAAFANSVLAYANPTALVQRLWNYCNILRDDVLSYGDYVEQLTFLLFLKMADEQSRPPFNKLLPIAPRHRQQSNHARTLNLRHAHSP